jgi:hypothetical protein
MLILQVYFTGFPTSLYRMSSRCGNMAHAGVALGLIQSQQMFWLASAILLLSNRASNYFSIHPTVGMIGNASSGCLYAASVVKYYQQQRFLRTMLN